MAQVAGHTGSGHEPNIRELVPDGSNQEGVVWGHRANGHLQIVDRAAARVRETYRDASGIERPRTKVALVGFSHTSMHLAPFGDPEWSIWGVNQLYRHIPRADRWFEIHKDPFWDQVKDSDYIGWMKRIPFPIYMVDAHDEIPQSLAYPIQDVIGMTGGRDYFTSSIAFMIALAIREQFQELALYGIDLADDSEYFDQRPCAEYWLGVAAGHGMKVSIHHRSALLKQYFRYGYETQTADTLSMQEIKKRLHLIHEAQKKKQIEQAHLAGAEEEAKFWVNLGLFRKRGGELGLDEALGMGSVESHRAYDNTFLKEAMNHGSQSNVPAHDQGNTGNQKTQPEP